MEIFSNVPVELTFVRELDTRCCACQSRGSPGHVSTHRGPSSRWRRSAEPGSGYEAPPAPWSWCWAVCRATGSGSCFLAGFEGQPPPSPQKLKCKPGFIFVRAFLVQNGGNVHLFSSSLPRFDKMPRDVTNISETFASARSFGVISWASFSRKRRLHLNISTWITWYEFFFFLSCLNALKQISTKTLGPSHIRNPFFQ